MQTGRLQASSITASEGMQTGRLQAASITASEGISSASLKTGKLNSQDLHTDYINAQDALFGDFNSYTGNVGLLSASSITGHDHTFVDPNSGAMGGIGIVNQDLKVIAPAGASLGFGYYDEQNNKVNDAITIGANLNTAFAENSTFNKNLNVLGDASISGHAKFKGPTTFGEATFQAPAVFNNTATFGESVNMGAPVNFSKSSPVSFNAATTFSDVAAFGGTAQFSKDVTFGGNVTTTGLETVSSSTAPVGADWFRLNNANINNAQNNGVAIHNGMAVNGGGGLSVGAWTKVPEGQAYIRDKLKVAHNMGGWVDNSVMSAFKPNNTTTVGASFGGPDWWSHFPWSDGDTYVRSGKANGNVFVSDIGTGKLVLGSSTQGASIETRAPIKVQGLNPGPLIEKDYGANQNKYGIGQFSNGEMRLYAPKVSSTATVNMSLLNTDGSYDDVITVNANNRNTRINGNFVVAGGNTAQINGTLRVCDNAGNNCRTI